MIKIKVDGVDPRADGEYEFDDLVDFTNRELHTIKQVSGLRVNEFQEALAAGDNDLVVAFIAIALTRAGKQLPIEVLWDAPAGKITFEAVADEEAGDAAVPPPSIQPSGSGSAPTSETDSADGSPTGSESGSTSSGSTSERTGDDHQAIPLRPTGTQG